MNSPRDASSNDASDGAARLPSWLAIDGSDIIVRVKAVPGASRDSIAGTLGDRLKVRIAAPPEGGRANASICALLACACDLPTRSVVLESGPAQAQKSFRIHSSDAVCLAKLSRLA